jgi:hypothetical protein
MTEFVCTKCGYIGQTVEPEAARTLADLDGSVGSSSEGQRETEPMIEPVTDAEVLADLRETIRVQGEELQAVFLALNPVCPAYPGQRNICDLGACDCCGAVALGAQVAALRSASPAPSAATPNPAPVSSSLVDAAADDLVARRKKED